MKIKVRSDYHICNNCGASLDPGEKCDCSKKESVVYGKNTARHNYIKVS